MLRVPVNHAKGQYEVVIGQNALDEETETLRSLTNSPSAIVADEAVWALHGKTLRAVLPDLPLVLIPSGEGTKSWDHFQTVSEALLKAGVERKGSVVAFGGGVTGDLAGFCAATLRRGAQLVMIPTTLLSQVDSSVGGKTAINTAAGKNLVGAFYAPSLVVIDTRFLETLPKRELLAGYAEVVKYGALGDAEFFGWLTDHGDAVIDLEPEALSRAIAKSCQAKADIVAQDERETGVRALLNLGHTFGHAVEAEGNYDGRILHGEAVALGMAMAARYSAAHGLCSPDVATTLDEHLAKMGLRTKLADLQDLPVTAEALLERMKQDKKVESGALTLILLRAMGDAFVAKDVDQASLLAFLKTEIEAPAL